MLEAKVALRRYGAQADITIADLTWTFGLPYDFMLEFDLIIVPSSNSKVEIASTEIFILEYVQRMMVKLRQREQLILVAPSRVDRNQLNQIKFPGLEFLDNYSVCPPIYRISQINNEALSDFWFRIDNGIISENMREFGEFVYEKVLQIRKKKAEAPMVLHPGFQVVAVVPVSSANPVNRVEPPEVIDKEPINQPIKPAPITPPAQKELSFIPLFLRKK